MRTKDNEKDGKREPRRSDLGRMTEEEYQNLGLKHPRAGEPRRVYLGRMTDEEYMKMWETHHPKKYF